LAFDEVSKDISDGFHHRLNDAHQHVPVVAGKRRLENQQNKNQDSIDYLQLQALLF
jgi:hypothetical protein